jgi:nicotinamide-nucleotide adenylyltransferase
MAFSSHSQYDSKTIDSMRKSYKSALSDFRASGSAFQIFCSVPDLGNVKAPVNTLYVLDSSFNPPTKAHMHLARSALMTDSRRTPLRLLLLLAIKNADKAPKPAAFEDRLVMMTLMAEEICREMREMREEEVVVDVGVTGEPFYYKKAEVIEQSGAYDRLKEGEQVHITGFDTIIRVFDPKYYPDGMSVLQSMFDKGKLRVHLRDGDEREQRGYLESIRKGEREGQGVKREWAQRIEMVEPMREFVSSTEARRCVVEHEGEGLGMFVGESVREYILKEKLYEEGV